MYHYLCIHNHLLIIITTNFCNNLLSIHYIVYNTSMPQLLNIRHKTKTRGCFWQPTLPFSAQPGALVPARFVP